MKKKQYGGISIVYLVILLVGLGLFYYISSNMGFDKEYRYNDFITDVTEDKVDDITIEQNKEPNTGVIIVEYKNGDKKRLYVSDVIAVQEALRELEKVDPLVKDVPGDNIFWTNIVPLIVMFVMVIFILSMVNGGANANGGKMANFGKSRAKLFTDIGKKETFKNVAGLHEEKEELTEIVDFLKEPKKYIEVGARIPKGVLLEGPPGTGKTLLAKAIAGEAGVPFLSISGSDFVEMFVGVGASRVRDLFEEAKKNAPCIVFIDEIDAVARRRGTGMGGGHDEREQTLNQLLVEMDGFGVNEGIIVLAATNRVDILDPAILRPGRFDRKVLVGRPDVKGREEILHVHAKNKPLGDDVDLREIARTTSGMTGADLENLLNEAAIHSAKNGRNYVIQSDINRSLIKVGIGAEKRSKVVSEQDRKVTAFHETGHAILFHVLPNAPSVHTVSIIPTGQGAAGYTMPLPEGDRMFSTRGRMLEDIMVGLGGRIAEELIFDDITTGASQDIKQVTGIAKAMVTQYGMSDALGLINYDENSQEVFIGKDIGHSRSYGEATATIIDQEVKKIVDECYGKARAIILENKDILYKVSELLLEKEKITGAEFETFFDAPVEETAAEDGISQVEVEKTIE